MPLTAMKGMNEHDETEVMDPENLDSVQETGHIESAEETAEGEAHNIENT